MSGNCGKQNAFCAGVLSGTGRRWGGAFWLLVRKGLLEEAAVLGDELEHGIQKLSLSARLSVSGRRHYVRLSFLVPA